MRAHTHNACRDFIMCQRTPRCRVMSFALPRVLMLMLARGYMVLDGGRSHGTRRSYVQCNGPPCSACHNPPTPRHRLSARLRLMPFHVGAGHHHVLHESASPSMRIRGTHIPSTVKTSNGELSTPARDLCTRSTVWLLGHLWGRLLARIFRWSDGTRVPSCSHR